MFVQSSCNFAVTDGDGVQSVEEDVAVPPQLEILCVHKEQHMVF